ncbi:tryptophan-rich sensory protein [Bacillus mycoides]
MEFVNSIFQTLLTSVIQLFSLIGVIIVIGFILGYLESLTRTYWSRAFGRKGFLLTAWIGVPVHELGHAIMCLVFRHKIIATQFFPTDISQGALGYVQHQYNQKSIYQRIGNFFIGIGPIISGITALILLMRYFVPESYSLFNTTLETTIASTSINLDMIQNMFLSTFFLLKSLFTMSNLLTPSFWLFLFIAICISAHIALSKPDIKGSIDGVIVMFIILFLFNIIAGLFQYDSNQLIGKVMKYNMYLIAFSSVALLFSSISTLVSFGFYKMRGGRSL